MTNHSNEEYISNFQKNWKLEPLRVRHQDLERVDDSEFRSRCPHCKEGTLMVERNPKNFWLRNQDYCLSCGRRYFYTDIIPDITLIYIKDAIQPKVKKGNG